MRDPLTGLFNRRYATETLRTLLENAGRGGTPVAVACFDVDRFKAFNDNHGHDVGDAVLRAVAETLSGACTGKEFACRFGGEEFVMVFPDLTGEEAALRADAVRKSIEELELRHAGQPVPQVTISAGIAACPEVADTLDALLKAGDTALYRAKASGRNLVCRARGDDDTATTDQPKPAAKTPPKPPRKAAA